MKKAVLAGSTGYLGRHIALALLDRDVRVTAVIHRRQPEVDHPLFQWRRGGLSGITTSWLDDRQPDAFFHAARPTMPRLRKWGRVLAGFRGNRLNTALIRSLRKTKNKPPLLYASGTLMYGNCSKTADEKTPLRPISYARQYYPGEKPILKALESGRCPVRILRLPWLLGNGSWFQWFYLDNIRRHNAIPLFGSGENNMSLLHVEDAGRLMVRYADRHMGDGIYNLFNPAGNMAQKDFAGMVADIFGCRVVPFRELYPKGVEMAVIEAFTAQLIPATSYSDTIDSFDFTSVEKTLMGIKAAFEV